MTQTALANKPTLPTNGTGKLPGLPKGPLTPTQQLEALRRIQTQAEQRIRLGLQLFQAAESHTTQQQRVVQQIKEEQEKLREQLQNDVAKSLQGYDQWVGRIDESFTRAMKLLESKIKAMESQWEHTKERLESAARRCDSMVDQNRAVIDQIEQQRSLFNDAEQRVDSRVDKVLQTQAVFEAKIDRMAAQIASLRGEVETHARAAAEAREEAAQSARALRAAEVRAAESASTATPVSIPKDIRPPRMPLAVAVGGIEESADEQHTTTPAQSARDNDPTVSISPSMMEQAEQITDAVESEETNEQLPPSICYQEIIDRFVNDDDPGFPHHPHGGDAMAS